MRRLTRKSKVLSGSSIKLSGTAGRSVGRYYGLLVLAGLLLMPLSVTAQIRLPQRRDVERILQGVKSQADAAQLGGRCEKLLKWSRQLEQEHSDKDLYRTQMNQLQAMAVPLFSDSAFVPYFGKPYERFSPDERHKYWLETMSKCFTSSQHRSAFTWQSSLLVSSFQARPLPHPLAAGQLVPALAALRQARSDLARMNAEIAALPATAETYRRLLQEKKSAEQPLRLVWPSEQRAFNSTLTAALGRSAKPALAAELDPLIANVQGYDGLLSLKRAPDTHKELLAAVTPDERSQYQQRIAVKFNAILTGLMNEEKAKLSKIGGGAAGLKQGAEWHYAFQARYSREFNGPEAEAVLQAFHAKRRSQLSAVEPELARMIRQARNEDEIDKLLREYLPLPGDDAVPGIDKLIQMAAARKQQLHRSEVLGTQATATSPGRRSGRSPSSRPTADEAPSDGREPTAEEIYDAVQAKIDAWNKNMKETIAACKAPGASQNPILGMQCITLLVSGGGDYSDFNTKITNFKKLGKCAAAVGKPGYVCTYILGISMNNPTLMAGFGRMMSGNVTEARFVRLEDGWLLMPDPDEDEH